MMNSSSSEGTDSRVTTIGRWAFALLIVASIAVGAWLILPADTDWRDAANAICADMNANIPTIDPSKDLEVLMEEGEGVQNQYASSAGELEKISVPEEFQGEYDEMISALRDMASDEGPPFDPITRFHEKADSLGLVKC
jgi:hypothetical protein